MAAALLPRPGADGDPGAAAAAAAAACEGLLWVAGEMLAATAEYRRDTGRAVDCRIGVSFGTVIVGVLGRLQPRLHIFGQVRAAPRPAAAWRSFRGRRGAL